MTKKEEIMSASEFVLGQMPPEEALRMLEKLESDPELSAEVEDCAMLLRVADECGDSVFAERRTGPWLVREDRADSPGLGAGKLVPPMPWGMVAGVIMAILLLLPWVSEEWAGPFSELAAVAQADVDVQMRGEGDRELAQANRLLHAGRQNEAIELLDRYLRGAPLRGNREYATYLLGGAHLLSARKSVLGLFATYDRERVAAGMGYLMEVVREGRSVRLVHEARWLRAKGYLMIGHPNGALDELSQILVQGGSRYPAGSAMARDIRNLVRGN